MAEINWPGGVPSEPLLDGFSWAYRESEYSFTTEAGDEMSGPRGTGLTVDMTCTIPMSRHQYKALFLPWWVARKTAGGCGNGAHAFWMRDPLDQVPYRWKKKPGTRLEPVFDGPEVLVRLTLFRLPSGAST